jgi:hypothetical protein
MKKFITAKTFPVDENGRFHSEPAEAAYDVARNFGLDRSQLRVIIQAYQITMDECTKKYLRIMDGD